MRPTILASTCCAALACGLLTLSLSTPALAATGADDAPTEVGAESSFSSTNAIGTVFTFVPRASYHVPRTPVWVDVEVPFAGFAPSGSVGERLRDSAGLVAGNPGFGTHTVLHLGRRASLTFGLTASLPVMSAECLPRQFTGLAAAANGAYTDFYRWAPSFVPLHAPVSVELRPARWLTARAGVDSQIYLPIGHEMYGWVPPRTTPLWFEVSHFELEAHAPHGVGAGLAVDEVWMPTQWPESFTDASQTSIEPFVSLSTHDLFVRAGVRVAVDAPLGARVASSADPALGIVAGTLRVGVRLD